MCAFTIRGLLYRRENGRLRTGNQKSVCDVGGLQGQESCKWAQTAWTVRIWSVQPEIRGESNHIARLLETISICS